MRKSKEPETAHGMLSPFFKILLVAALLAVLPAEMRNFIALAIVLPVMIAVPLTGYSFFSFSRMYARKAA